MYKMIFLFRDYLFFIINMLILVIVDNNLNFKNLGIYVVVMNVVQVLIQYVDNYLFLQLFCIKVQFLNGKVKQDMMEKFVDIVMEFY